MMEPALRKRTAARKEAEQQWPERRGFGNGDEGDGSRSVSLENCEITDGCATLRPPCGHPGANIQAPVPAAALADSETVNGVPNSKDIGEYPESKLQVGLSLHEYGPKDTEPLPPASAEDSRNREIRPSRGGPGVVNVSVHPALPLASQLGCVTFGDDTPASAPTSGKKGYTPNNRRASASIDPDVPSGLTNGSEQLVSEVTMVVPSVQLAVENELARKPLATASTSKRIRRIDPSPKKVAELCI